MFDPIKEAFDDVNQGSLVSIMECPSKVRLRASTW
jgi:hypothetical protein